MAQTKNCVRMPVLAEECGFGYRRTGCVLAVLRDGFCGRGDGGGGIGSGEVEQSAESGYVLFALVVGHHVSRVGLGRPVVHSGGPGRCRSVQMGQR